MSLSLSLDLWTANRSGGGAAAPKPIAFNTPLIVIGPSIQNVVNTRSPRMWMMAASGGHFYPTPGTNQATGGGCATIEGATQQGNVNNYYEHASRIDLVMNQLGDAGVRGKCLVFYDPGPNDLADISTGEPGTNGLTTQKLKDAADRWVARVTGAGHMIALAVIAKSDATDTNAFRETARTGYNAYIETLHDPAAGIFFCGTRDTLFDATMTYDGLHPVAGGARTEGALGDFVDLEPYCDFSTSQWIDASAYVNPFGQSGNSKWAMGSSGGTAGTGSSGTVANALSVYCTSNGQSGGSTVGISAVCTLESSVSVVVNGRTYTMNKQKIRITGTASGAGVCTLIGSVVKGTSAAQYYNWGEFGQAAFLGRVYGASYGDAPGGIRGLGVQYGLMGQAMNKTIETNAGLLDADTGVICLRTVPVQSLKLNGAQNAEWSVAWSSGATVDATVEVYQAWAEQVELVAYAAPFNLSQLFPSGSTNPLTRRPALTFTAQSVGGTATLNPPCVSGGGVALYGTSLIKDQTESTVATFLNTANPSTYVLQAAEAGDTIRMTGAASNSYDTIVIDDGPTYAIP